MTLRSRIPLAFCIGLVTATLPLAGQPAEPQAEPQPTFNVSIPSEGEVILAFPAQASPEAVVARTDETISVDFPDEDVRTILLSVAELYELNVVIPDTLVGRTTLKLRNVTWRQVFDVILEPIGFTYIEDRNIIKIKSRTDLMQEPVDTRVFVINYAEAGQLQGSISPLVDAAAGGRIQVDARSNALVITERPSRMNNIQEIIERLDRPTAQVMIESKFIEVTKRDATNIGINWSSLGGYQMRGGPFEREYTRDNQTGTASGRSAQSSTNTSNTSTTSVPGGFTSTDTTTTTGLIDSIASSINQVATGRIDTALFSADAFSLILSFLQSDNNVHLVSNPTVVTLNNTPAQINIGEEFPVPDYTYNAEQGTFEVSGFTYKPIGIILNVTPQVNSAGFINLNIAPEISSRAGTVNFGGAAGAEIPIISTRKTRSSVTIKDGFTLAIGGLIEKSTVTTANRVPILGDIPFLGRAFRSNSDTEDVRNLIIFITAKTLNPDGSTYKEIFSERTLFNMGVQISDVPGYQVPEDEKRLYEELRQVREEAERARLEAELQQRLQAARDVMENPPAERPSSLRRSR